MRVARLTFASLCALAVALAVGACAFDTSALDGRRCSDDGDCSEPGQRCVEGVCQSVGGDVGNGRDDLRDDVADVPTLRCTDDDGDGSFAGPDCTQPVAQRDCAPFDPEVYPGAAEICDGKDNDCDEIDDDADDDYVAEVCRLQDGVCARALRPCIEGRLGACEDEDYGPFYERGEEASCDGRDNDCDGDVDEDLFTTCYDGADPDSELLPGRPCSEGRQACVDGRFPQLGDDDYDCVGQVLPAPTEDTPLLRCDGQDNNCDGEFDEDCTCLPGETQTCYSSTAVGTEANAPCRTGFIECGPDARFGGPCLGERVPDSAETCADPGVDNDCDGDNTPSDIEGFGETCDTGLFGVCQAGTRACVGDALDCVPLEAPEDETCANPGEDNDCDGIDDNIPGLGEPCTVMRFGDQDIFGQCQNGTFRCHEGALVCMPAATTTEVCNLIDDDCDGEEDDADEVDTSEDEANCGACFVTCEGDADTCCDGGCTDTTSDLRNCGDCGVACSAPGGTPACCEVGGVGTCADLDASEAHCGDCNAPCEDGDSCCDGGCTDTQTDEANCGACGFACGEDEQCCGGGCVALDSPEHCGACATACDDDQLCCGDGAFTCVSASAEGSCGGCGVACAGDGTQPECCDLGAGVGACFDLAAGDIENCGGCGTSCTGTAPVCCTGLDDVGFCADSADDAANCGGCGNVCGGVSPACCVVAGQGTCADLDSDEAHCGDCGQACSGDADTCCAEGCRDLDVDPAHCGACGIACDLGESCCGGLCVDLTVADEGNCGGCGVVCDPFAGESCCAVGEGFACVMTSGASCPSP